MISYLEGRPPFLPFLEIRSTPAFGATDMRAEIIKTLGNIGPAAKEALPLLQKIANEEMTNKNMQKLPQLAKEAIAKINAESQTNEQ